MSPSRPRTMAWERGTARVLHQGRPVGGAFLIPGRFVITCSHVVAAIAGLPDDQPLPADFPVTLDFPLLPDHPVAEATVHFSVPVAPDNSGDVAVLQLTGPPPADAVPLRLVEADDLAGHRWRAFGFPHLPGPVIFNGHVGIVWSAVFSPDGRTLATSSDDGTVRLWNTEVFRDLPNLIERVCAVAGRSMTQAEWQEYVPGRVPYRQICP